MVQKCLSASTYVHTDTHTQIHTRRDATLFQYQGCQEKVHGRTKYMEGAFSSDQKLGSKAFHWYMTNLYGSIQTLNIPPETFEPKLSMIRGTQIF